MARHGSQIWRNLTVSGERAAPLQLGASTGSFRMCGRALGPIPIAESTERQIEPAVVLVSALKQEQGQRSYSCSNWPWRPAARADGHTRRLDVHNGAGALPGLLVDERVILVLLLRGKIGVIVSPRCTTDGGYRTATVRSITPSSLQQPPMLVSSEAISQMRQCTAKCRPRRRRRQETASSGRHHRRCPAAGCGGSRASQEGAQMW